MSLGETIQAWRLSRGRSLTDLEQQAGLPSGALGPIESGEADPPASAVDALARALGVPPSWLYASPKQLALLTTDGDGDGDEVAASSVDPVVERILLASRDQRELFVLLTALLQSGDPKLIRAADASLRSLVKQSRRATVPWQSRPSGHFEPPSD